MDHEHGLVTCALGHGRPDLGEGVLGSASWALLGRGLGGLEACLGWTPTPPFLANRFLALLDPRSPRFHSPPSCRLVLACLRAPSLVNVRSIPVVHWHTPLLPLCLTLRPSLTLLVLLPALMHAYSVPLS